MGMKHKNVDSEKCVFKKHIYNWYPQKDKRRHFVQRQDDKITENKKELPDIKKRMPKIKKKMQEDRIRKENQNKKFYRKDFQKEKGQETERNNLSKKYYQNISKT